ncbi:MAG: transcription elongation factor GreA [Patescibacteria group bacterium]|nr:transcription elongation factor GreA [Patescibacteria group bacterium]MDD5121638.1 transcription elongation factor GreA [Patescibacteria group bacterium]MDD5221908.1 transcription elongation factor GreA [Patescibacteria group bacterium]MDD5396198.1 transcription elongation factor GreA [Patescibacteria group bacterium]
MTHITKKELEKLKKELETRTTKTRQEIAEMMRTAKDQGDLSENAEYFEARENQWENDNRINELQQIISEAEIVEERRGGGKIDVGSTVKLKSASGIVVFTIVSPEGVDLDKKMISFQSPLGQALMGKKTSDEIEITAPKGKIKYKIIEVK